MSRNFLSLYCPSVLDLWLWNALFSKVEWERTGSIVIRMCPPSNNPCPFKHYKYNKQLFFFFNKHFIFKMHEYFRCLKKTTPCLPNLCPWKLVPTQFKNQLFIRLQHLLSRISNTHSWVKKGEDIRTVLFQEWVGELFLFCLTRADSQNSYSKALDFLWFKIICPPPQKKNHLPSWEK